MAGGKELHRIPVLHALPTMRQRHWLTGCSDAEAGPILSMLMRCICSRSCQVLQGRFLRSIRKDNSAGKQRKLFIEHFPR